MASGNEQTTEIKQPDPLKRVRDLEAKLAAREEEIAKHEKEVAAHKNAVAEYNKQVQGFHRAKEKLDKREEGLDAREEKYKEGYQKLLDDKEQFKLEKKQFEGEKKALLKKVRDERAAIQKREQEALKREQDAEMGFGKIEAEFRDNMQKHYTAVEQDLRERLKELTALHKDIANDRKELTDEVLEETRTALQTYRETFTNTIDFYKKEADRIAKECEETTREIHARLRKELQKEITALEKDRANFEKEKSAFAAQRLEFRQEKNDLDAERDYLELEQENYRRRLDTLDDIIAERMEQERESHQRQLDARDAHIETLRTDRERLQRAIEEMEDFRRFLDGRPPGEVLADLRGLQKEIERLSDCLADLPGEAEVKQLRADREELTKVNLEVHRLTEELAAARRTSTRAVISVGELEEAQRLIEHQERIKQARELEITMLNDSLERLRGIFNAGAEETKRAEAINRPYFDLKKKPKLRSGVIEEGRWLMDIQRSIRSAEFEFSPRLLKAFHTSLKTAEWSPLTVLAGVSGTGKSELPRLYSRFGGLHFLSQAVQPDWDGPHALFGFFNSVDNQFNATSLVRAMAQSQRSPEDGGFNDALMLVLLDEMNLAHVELYFSELLSKLESRRGETNDVHVEIDLGAGVDKYELPLGRNVLWAGTMNEDETTVSLSDKVLDRGNIIGFPRPKTFKDRRDLHLGEPAKMLPKSEWEKWIRPVRDFTQEEITPFKEELERINSLMSEAGRAIGHRVWQSIERYMLLYPDVRELLLREQQASRADADGEDGVDGSAKETQVPLGDELTKAMTRAYEDQLVQKVMPKLRGVETMGSSRQRCLEPMLDLIRNSDHKLALEGDMEAAMNSAQGVFVWKSARYLLEGGD